MRQYVTYSPVSGRIISTGLCKDDEVSLQSEFVVDAALNADIFPKSHYIFNNEVTPRPDQSTKLSGQILANLPVPCTIHINDTTYDCQDVTAELDFIFPGTYYIKVESFPYLDWEVEITV